MVAYYYLYIQCILYTVYYTDNIPQFIEHYVQILSNNINHIAP